MIALSLLFIINRSIPFLYATPLVVVTAYVLRHMPQAVRGTEAALGQVSGTLEEAGACSVEQPRQTFFKVTLPLALPGMLAGAALVFLTSLKELPATLLLRPAGFDTLAVRAWTWAVDGSYVQAAPAALLLVLIFGSPAVFFTATGEAISMTRLEVKNLSKSYNRHGLPAVCGVSFTLESSEILALVGPSGCGKTTTLRLIAGLEVPDNGTISLEGGFWRGRGNLYLRRSEEWGWSSRSTHCSHT